MLTFYGLVFNGEAPGLYRNNDGNNSTGMKVSNCFSVALCRKFEGP